MCHVSKWELSESMSTAHWGAIAVAGTHSCAVVGVAGSLALFSMGCHFTWLTGRLCLYKCGCLAGLFLKLNEMSGSWQGKQLTEFDINYKIWAFKQDLEFGKTCGCTAMSLTT